MAVGGADFAASTLAAGVIEPGEACLMLGTAGNLIMPLATPDFDTRLINSHHVGCDRFLAVGGTLSGALQEWFRSVAAPGIAFETLDAEAAAVPPGADGLRLLPYLQGERTPVWDAGATGAFVGLSLVHGRGHLYRAVLESVAVSFRHCAEVAAEKGARLREVIAVNGGARSAVWRQILADIFGSELVTVNTSEGAAFGAALLAAAGCGAFVSAEEAVAAAVRITGRTAPGEQVAAYEEAYAVYRQLYPSLKGLFAELSS